MQRRALLRGLMVGVPAATGTAVAAWASRSSDYVKNSSESSITALKDRIDELKARFDAADARNRKLLRVAIILALASLGLDATALL